MRKDREMTICGAGTEAGLVASFFAGKDVFITGGSGFIGRVLVEKLLREVPDIGTIFLLVRPKKGVSAHDRLEKFTNVSLFDIVRRQQPAAMSKLRVVEGDVALLGLGLSDGDRALLEERVSVVFHAAASVRFDDPLPKAVRLNTRGARELCEMALRMRRLEALVHVSTAFSNCDCLEIDEKLYPPPGDWRTYAESIDNIDPLLLEILTPKLVENRVNTYVFTKALAEHAVNEYRTKLPIAIIRPSVVTCAAEEPFPGWVDNFYGPTAMLIAGNLGALHVVSADKVEVDVIPVDYVVRGMILAAAKLAMIRNPDILPIYNAAASTRDLVSFTKILESSFIFQTENRTPRVYKHFGIIESNLFLFKLLFFLIDLPISVTLDSIAWGINQPRRMVKIHRRSVTAILKNYYFSHRTFKFHNFNYLSLNEKLNPKDKQRFQLSIEHILWEPFWFFSQSELIKYFFPKSNVNPGRVNIISEVIHFTICGILLLLVWKSSILTPLIRITFNILKFVSPLPILQLLF